MKGLKANVYVDTNLISQLCIIVDIKGKTIEGTYDSDTYDSIFFDNANTIICGGINKENNLLLVLFKEDISLFNKVTKYFEITENIDCLFDPSVYNFEIKGFEIDINTGEVLSQVRIEFIEEYDNSLGIKRLIELRMPRFCPYYQALFLKYSDKNSKMKKECFEEELDYSQMNKEATKFVHEALRIPMVKTEEDNDDFDLPF